MHVPLMYLRTFEAAARHESFARAAEELHVTPAAVSQQIRALEDRLQTRLFARGVRSLALTRQGRDYAAEVGIALERIEQATRAIGSPLAAGPLRIGTFPSLAMHWLLPRLGGFRARYPEIDPILDIRTDLSRIGGDGVDVALRFGPGLYPGCTVERLMDERSFPVCSPALLEERGLPRRIADLAQLPLIHDDSLAPGEARMSWPSWLGDHYEKVPESRRLRMPDGLFSMQAALLGQGAAIVLRSQTHDYLRSGRLVRLTNEERSTAFSHWIVTAEGEADARVAAFRSWVLEEAAGIADG